MTTWDTFLFAAELDMLELRLATLGPVVDRFVLVESPVSHAGRPKPLYYLAARGRFAAWHDRIVHVVADRLPSGAFDQEDTQREYCWQGIGPARPGDLILHGDVDEIPDPDLVAALAADPPHRPVVFEQALFMFAVDWRHPDPWPGTVAVRRGDGSFGFGWLRGQRHTAPRLRGGWHFSWLGDSRALELKVELSGHPDLAPVPALNRERPMAERGSSPWGDLDPVAVDGSYPAWIRDRNCPPCWFRPADMQATQAI